MRFLLLLIFVSCIPAAQAQVTGTVTDEKGLPLSFASISIPGSPAGVISNSEGRFQLQLSPGSYSLVARYVGYRPEEKKVVVGRDKLTLEFRLVPQDLTMPEVVIRRGEDPAVSIMRQAIKKRPYYASQVDSFAVDVYIKGLMRSRAIPDRVLGQKIDKTGMEKEGFDSLGKGILFLSESVTKVSFHKPARYKYEVVSSRQSGGGFGLSLPFFIDFYSSNVSVFSNNLNPRGFISPLADNAFHYYKFRFEGSFFEGNDMIDRIRVIPRRRNEPLFDGFLQIVDGTWRIHSLDLLTTKNYQLELLDTLRISQLHSAVATGVWRVENQTVYVAAKFFGFDATGNFLNVYSNYNINPGFGKKHFDRILMKYDTAFNKKDSIYWNNVRPVALEADEKQNFLLRDSLRTAARDSMYTQRNIDSLRKARRRIELKDFLIRGAGTHWYAPSVFTDYSFKPLLRHTAFNTVEGLSLTAVQQLNLRPRKGKNDFSIGWNTRFGFSNQHLNSDLRFTVRPKAGTYRNRYFQIAGGKRLSQFNREEPIDELTNSFYTLFYKRNYIKLYENWFGSADYNNRFDNGMTLHVSGLWEKRMPVQNTTDYSFFKKESVLLPNHPYELADIPFEDHKAATLSVSLAYQPGHQYIEFPWRKVLVGSKYPTFELMYAKGIPGIFGSVTDFDKWQFSVYDEMNLKLMGTFHYRLNLGGFLTSRRVEIPDMKHFNGNQTFYNSQYVNSFQLAPYYRYSNTEPFYVAAHAEHHFNGLVTNKIPLFNRLKWNLVGGTNTFYVNRDNYYVELFGGLENIFKMLRVDLVTATQAGSGSSLGVRVGFGGILGKTVLMAGQ